MKTLETKIDKISASDPFDFQLSIRGLIYQLMEMHSNIYEYAYYFTFKRTRKEYAREFNDAFEMPITEQSFFLDTGDRVVIHCCNVETKLLDLQEELTRRFLIDLMDNCQDQVAEVQSKRFAPYRMLYKKSKSYKKLKIYYEKTLVQYIEYLYKMGCVFTASTYRVPLVLKRQFLKHESLSLRLLNCDDDTVALLMDYIVSLRVELETFGQLNINKKNTK